MSSEPLAELAGVNAAKVRKDLSHLGSYGTRGVGYDVEYLLYQMRQALGLTQDWPVVIVGAGNLGQALANYGGFGERGFPVGGAGRRRPGQGRHPPRPTFVVRPWTTCPSSPRAARRHRHHRHPGMPPRRSPTAWWPPG